MPEQEYMTGDYDSGNSEIGRLPKGITIALMKTVDFVACGDLGNGHAQRFIMRVFGTQDELDAIAATAGCVKLPDAGQDFTTKYNSRMGTSLATGQINALNHSGRMAKN